MKWFIESEESWRHVVSELMPQIALPTLFLLQGPMGSGKTTFVREVLRNFDAEETASPTFNLRNDYRAWNRGALLPVYHLDLYRLTPDDKATDLFDFFLDDGDFLAFVEWPEKLPLDYDLSGAQIIRLLFAHLDNGRTLEQP